MLENCHVKHGGWMRLNTAPILYIMMTKPGPFVQLFFIWAQTAIIISGHAENNNEWK